VQTCERFHGLVEGHIGLESANPICPLDSPRQATFSLPTNPRLLDALSLPLRGMQLVFVQKKQLKMLFVRTFSGCCFWATKPVICRHLIGVRST
jgi:hypothetical protein